MQEIHPIFLFLLFAVISAFSQTNDNSKLSAEERALAATKAYSLVQEFFDSRDEPRGTSANAAYETYLRAALASDDRRQFDLATIEFVAQLHNSHTFFWDTWLDKDNQPLSFYAAPLDGYWIIQTSFLPELKPGDIIVKIDDLPTESFFKKQRRYISASSAVAESHNLFLLPYLFPQQFILTLDGGRKVTIDRAKLNRPEQKADSRWLKPGKTAYIRIPAFFYPQFEEEALAYVRQFQKARTLILDVRNNAGGVQPKQLIEALMDRPYHAWKESTTFRLPLVDSRQGEQEKKDNSSTLPEVLRTCKPSADRGVCSLPVTWGGEVVAPDRNAFNGRIILLVDGGCVSACEELVEPFKDSGRGTIVGETTEGSSGLPYVYDFNNGMILKISVKRLYFPDGSEFEGIGIKPDIEVHPTIDSLKSGHDVILEKALEFAQTP